MGHNRGFGGAGIKGYRYGGEKISHRYIYSSRSFTKTVPKLVPSPHIIPTMIKEMILGVKKKTKRQIINI